MMRTSGGNYFWPVTAVVILAIAMPLAAQEVTASIIGTVTDAAQAVVPNATVTITNTDRNITLRTLKTGESGQFVGTLLPIGHYAVTVEAPGFKRAQQKDIMLNVNDRATVNISLEIGEMTQEVSVVGNAVAVETQTATNSTTIAGNQLRELQINNRNFLQLVTLMPGVSVNNNNDTQFIGISNPSGSVATIPLSINGGRTSQNAWIVDGADILDRGSNLTLTNYPSVEAIEEFKVLRGQYSAEFGRAAAGQVNIITRSGSSDLHGDAYEFFRNDKLNANNFFNNRSGIARPPVRYNNFGWTLGGPVYIPKVYNGRNHTFFFFSEEWRRQLTTATVGAALPSADQKNGIFSTAVCTAFDSAGTCTSTGTRIANISPTAAAYIKDIFSKLPDGTGTGAQIFNVFSGKYFYRQELFKIDQVFNEKFSLWGRFINDSIPTTEPGGLFTGLTVPGVATTSTNSPGRGVAIRATNTFTSRWLNEVGYTWSHGDIQSNPIGLIGTAQSPDIRPKLVYPNPVARVQGLNFDTGFDGLGGFGPYIDPSNSHTVFDNMTRVLGHHTVKFGFALAFYDKKENQVSDPVGGFNVANSGAPVSSNQGLVNQTWANFLLGRVSSFSQAQTDLVPILRARQYEFYVQDDIHVRRNFTLNIGLRYGLYRTPSEANNILTNFDPKLWDPAKAPRVNPTTGQIVSGTGDLLNGVIISGKNSPWGDKVSNEDNKSFAPRVGFSWDPFGTGKTAIRSGYGIAYDVPTVGIWQNNIGQNPPFSGSVIIRNTSLDDPGSVVASPNNAPATLRATPIPYSAPYVQQWSFDVQREVARDFIIQIGYYASKGTHLIGAIDINTLRVGQLVAAGLLPAGTALTTARTGLVNAQRPFIGFAGIQAIETAFNSNYESLQFAAKKRFGGRTQINVSYTWGKTVTDAQTDRSTGFADAYNTRLDRAEANFSRRHVATGNYIYDLPKLQSSAKFVRGLFGGWELSGIVAMGTGLPLTVTVSSSTDPAGVGLALDTAFKSSRPDRVGDPSAVPRSVSRWFNTDAFARVPTGQVRLGNSPRAAFIGPGYWRVDQGLFKNFKLAERLNLQIRSEATNLFNHTNFAGVGTTLGSGSFGTITSVRDPRNIQFGAKVQF